MAWPEVRIDWDDEGFDTHQAKTPIYDRGSPITIRYGRDTGRAFAPTAPGQAGFEINNRSGNYHPDNDTSPLHDDLRPGAPVRITAPHPDTGDQVVLFRGFVDDYDLDVDPTRASVDVTCTDALSRLRGSTVSTDLHQGLRTGEAIGLLLDAAGWPADSRELDRGATVIPWWWCDNADVGAELSRLLDSEGPGSLLTVNTAGDIVFRDRHHRLTRDASTAVQATYRGVLTEPAISGPMRYDHGWKDMVNAVSIPVEVRSPAPDLAVVGTASGTWHIPDGVTVPLTVTAGDPFVGALTPVLDVDYTAAGGTVTMTLSRTSGQSTTVNVTASGGSATVTDVNVRAYPVVGATVVVEAVDVGSINRHGRRSWPSGRDPVYASLWDAQSIAEIIVGSRAQRLPTVTFTIHGAGHALRAAEQLTRDLSDRVHVTAAGLDTDMYVERIEHTFGAVARDTVFVCEKVPEQPGNVLILDDPVLGILGTHELGGIGLDDPGQILILDSATQGDLDTHWLAH